MLVDLSCLDDDAQGEPLTVLWEHELGPQGGHRGRLRKLTGRGEFAELLRSTDHSVPGGSPR